MEEMTAARTWSLEEMLVEAPKTRKPNGYWTRDRIKQSAWPWRTKITWAKGDPKGYNAAHRDGLINDPEIIGHMKKGYKGRDLTDDLIAEIFSKYNSKVEVEKADPSAYSAAYRRGIAFVDKICAHMKITKARNGHWNNYQNVLNAAKSCSGLTEFNKKFKGAASFLQKNPDSRSRLYSDMGWQENAGAKPAGYWNDFDNLVAALKECGSLSKMNLKYPAGYIALNADKNIRDRACKAAGVENNYGKFKTFEGCRSTAAKYNSPTDLCAGNIGCYRAIIRNEEWKDIIYKENGWYNHQPTPSTTVYGYPTNLFCEKTGRRVWKLGKGQDNPRGRLLDVRRSHRAYFPEFDTVLIETPTEPVEMFFGSSDNPKLMEDRFKAEFDQAIPHYGNLAPAGRTEMFLLEPWEERKALSLINSEDIGEDAADTMPSAPEDWIAPELPEWMR